MFCPQGFTPLSRLVDQIPHDTFSRCLETAEELVTPREGETDEDIFGRFGSVAPADWAEGAFFGSLRGDVFMASPQGQLLKIDLTTVRDSFAFAEFTIMELEALKAKGHDFPEHFYHSFYLFDSQVNEFISEYLNPNSNPSGLNLWAFAKSLGVERKHHILPMFFERANYTISLQAPDFLHQFNDDERPYYEDTLRILRPFEGWSLCVKDSFVEKEWADHWSKKDRSRPHVTVVGRPSVSRDKAGLVYQRLFPEGHGSLSWLELLGRVNGEMENPVSVDTLKRAVKSLQRHSKPRKTP